MNQNKTNRQSITPENEGEAWSKAPAREEYIISEEQWSSTDMKRESSENNEENIKTQKINGQTNYYRKKGNNDVNEIHLYILVPKKRVTRIPQKTVSPNIK